MDYGSVMFHTVSRRVETPDTDLLNDEPYLAEMKVVHAMQSEIQASGLAIIKRYNKDHPMLVTTVSVEFTETEA